MLHSSGGSFRPFLIYFQADQEPAGAACGPPSGPAAPAGTFAVRKHRSFLLFLYNPPSSKEKKKKKRYFCSFHAWIALKAGIFLNARQPGLGDLMAAACWCGRTTIHVTGNTSIYIILMLFLYILYLQFLCCLKITVQSIFVESF